MESLTDIAGPALKCSLEYFENNPPTKLGDKAKARYEQIKSTDKRDLAF